VSAKRSGTRLRQATCVMRQAVLGTKLDREEDFYIALDEGHDAMLWLGSSYECNLYWDNT